MRRKFTSSSRRTERLSTSIGAHVMMPTDRTSVPRSWQCLRTPRWSPRVPTTRVVVKLPVATGGLFRDAASSLVRLTLDVVIVGVVVVQYLVVGEF